MSTPVLPARRVAIIGGGPAGLMAAETVRAAGHAVDLYEAKGSPGRKFLIAGKGGLNLTHSDPQDVFGPLPRACGRGWRVAGRFRRPRAA